MTTVWAPHPGSQVQFLTCPIFECLLEGTRGGGKTAALLMSFAQYVGCGFGQAWRGVLFRETYPQLADVATKSKQWFRLFFPGAKFNESTYTWKFPDGEELLLRQGVKEDDYWDYHGHEFCLAEGTMVRTPGGLVRIESLRPGDYVVTLDGAQQVTRTWDLGLKPCVEALTFDGHRRLVSRQVQSEGHRLLTSAGMPHSLWCESCGSALPVQAPAFSWHSHKSLSASSREIPETGGLSADPGSFGATSHDSRQEGLRPAGLFDLEGPMSLVMQSSASHLPRSTGSHFLRILHAQALDSIQSLQSSLLGQLPSSGPFQQWPDRGALSENEDAPRYLSEVQGSRWHCHSCGHSNDGRLQLEEESGLSRAQQRGGAGEPVHASLHTGDPATARRGIQYGDGLAVPHPYGKESIEAGQLSCFDLSLNHVGARRVYDITVDKSNHYLSEGGFVNSNCWLGFEELTNWRSLAFYEMMHSCCRSSQPGMPRMVRATTNPYGRGHAAVKERFQLGTGGVAPGTIIKDTSGRERTHVHSDIMENITLLASDPDYMATLDGIKDANRKKAWRYGSWDINVGAFLADAWDPEKHIVKPFPIPANWNIWMAMDWGYAKPYAIGWFAKDPEGKTYMWRELYGIATDDDGKPMANVGTKETPDKVAKRIIAREAHDERVGYDISLRITGPDAFARGGSQYGTQITHAQTMRRHGLKFRPWWAGPGSRKAGALLVKQTLEQDELAFFDTCVHAIRTVPTLNPDPDDPDDVATDEEDHAFDMLKAALMRRTSTPPGEEESFSGDYNAGGAHIQPDGSHRIDRIQR